MHSLYTYNCIRDNWDYLHLDKPFGPLPSVMRILSNARVENMIVIYS